MKKFLLIFILLLPLVMAEDRPFNIKTNVTVSGYTAFNQTYFDFRIDTENEHYVLSNITVIPTANSTNPNATNFTSITQVFEFNIIRNVTALGISNLTGMDSLILSCNAFFNNFVSVSNLSQCWVNYEEVKKNKQACDSDLAFEKNNYDNVTQLRIRSPTYNSMENNVNTINNDKTACVSDRDKYKTALDAEVNQRLWKYIVGIVIGGLAVFGYYYYRNKRFSHVEKEVDRKNPEMLDEAERIAGNKNLRDEVLRHEKEIEGRAEPY